MGKKEPRRVERRGEEAGKQEMRLVGAHRLESDFSVPLSACLYVDRVIIDTLNDPQHVWSY